MIFGDNSAAYLLKQSVTITEYQGPGAAPISETQANDAILLVSTANAGLEWKRTIDQYLGDEPTFQALKMHEVVDRERLWSRHLEEVGKRKFKMGVVAPLEFSSDLLNLRPSIKTDKDSVPLDYRLFFLPTVLPAMPGPESKVGEPYVGTFRAQVRGFDVLLPYKVAVVSQDLSRRVLELTWSEDPIQAAGDKLTIIVSTVGKIRFEYAGLQRLPDSITGQTAITVHGVFISTAAEVTQAQLEKCDTKWTCRRVLLPFDSKSLYPESWADSEPLGRPTQPLSQQPDPPPGKPPR